MGRLSEFVNSHNASSSSSSANAPPAYNPSNSSNFREEKAPPIQFQQENMNSYKTHSEPPPPFPHMYACLHLARTDRLRLIGLPANTVPAVEEAIRRAWPLGIQEKGEYYGGYEWKLSGRPWQGGSYAIVARRLMSHVLNALSTVGWDLHQACDLSKKGLDKDTLFLHSVPPRQRYYFAISFNESDKVRIIDPPDAHVKQTFIRAVEVRLVDRHSFSPQTSPHTCHYERTLIVYFGHCVATAAQTWPLGIQTAHEKEPGAWQLKLRGNPFWSSTGSEVVQARLLGCTILSAMESVGFELVGSVDMSMGNGDQGNDRECSCKEDSFTFIIADRC